MKIPRCFAKLEKVLKLREDTDEEIVGYIKSVGAQFITEARPTEATVSPSTPRRKRQLSPKR